MRTNENERDRGCRACAETIRAERNDIFQTILLDFFAFRSTRIFVFHASLYWQTAQGIGMARYERSMNVRRAKSVRVDRRERKRAIHETGFTSRAKKMGEYSVPPFRSWIGRTQSRIDEELLKYSRGHAAINGSQCSFFFETIDTFFSKKQFSNLLLRDNLSRK